MPTKGPLGPTLYRWVIRLLPPSVFREDGEEMGETFEAMWGATSGLWAQIRLSFLAFGRLPWVVVLEWLEVLGVIRAYGMKSNQRRWGMSSWGGNLRLALRTLRKAPAFTFTTVVLLGLGLGSVTTIFTLVDHVLLRDLPYPAQERLIVVENGSHSGPVWRELQELSSVEMWGASWSNTASLVGEGDPLRITATGVSRDFFPMFGARPGQGRLLSGDDFEASNVAVLGHAFWQRAFGGDPGVVGRSIRIDTENERESLLVVGVLAEGFVVPEGLGHGAGPDVWRPMDWSFEGFQTADMWVLDVMGRMSASATLADVNGELERAAENLGRAYPEARLDRDGTPVGLPAVTLQEGTTRRVRMGLGLLLGAVGLLLLVACMNVAHLFLARGLGRVREMAVRRALGARTGSLVQQLLVESLILGTLGGALGLLLASLGLRSFLSLNPRAIPWASDVSLDFRVLGFAVAISAATVLLFGLLPALRSVRYDLTHDLKGTSRGSTTGRGTSRLRNGLVVVEVALSLVLVAEAGLLLRSFMKVQSLDPGIEIAGVWTIPLSPTGLASPEDYVQSMDEVEASLARVPGVRAAAYSLTLPMEMAGTGRCCWSTSTLEVGGEKRENTRMFLQPITESYFQVLGVPLVSGRIWTDSEAGSDPWPTVLNESMAVEIFGSADRALNQIMDLRGDRVVVTGVAEDTRHFGLDQDVERFVYLPVEKLTFTIPMAHMAVSMDREAPAGWVRTLREAVWAADPTMPVPTVRSMQEWVEESTAGRRFDGLLFGAFGLMGLILAAAGLYGTLLYAVGQRRRELGVRMALGAGRNRVQRQVVIQGMLLTAVGCLVGLGAAWGVGRFLESRLFGLSSTDPLTLLGTVGVLLSAAALASWFPARRASRVDPMEVLREE